MYLSAHDIHAELNGHLSLWTIRQYMANGTIEARKIGNKWLCTRKQFEAYVNSCRASVNAVEEVEHRLNMPKRVVAEPINVRTMSTREIFKRLGKEV